LRPGRATCYLAGRNIDGRGITGFPHVCKFASLRFPARRAREGAAAGSTPEKIMPVQPLNLQTLAEISAAVDPRTD